MRNLIRNDVGDEVPAITMPANALIQTRIDPRVKAQVTAVLEELGITVSEAVRILLTRTANEGALPFPLAANAEAHDRWFRAKVQMALDDPRAVPHEEVKTRFARRRAAALKAEGYIEIDSPRAAARIDDQIEAQVELLTTTPEIGRPGRVCLPPLLRAPSIMNYGNLSRGLGKPC
jgi:DNA-damage-inducible protein J